MPRWALAGLSFVLFVLIRLLFVIWRTHNPTTTARKANAGRKTRRLAVVLGSGGHTAEMIRILSQLDGQEYQLRLFITSAGDAHSARLAAQLQKHRHTHDYTVVEVPRARRVLQPLWSTPWTASHCLRACLSLFLFAKMSDIDVLVMNGPGTCVPVCLTAFGFRLLGLRSPRLVYIESLARTKRLSLTAKLVQPLVDSMLVQWPALEGRGKWWRARRVYTGWLQ